MPTPYNPNPQLPVTHPQALAAMLGGGGLPPGGQPAGVRPTLPTLADPIIRQKLVQHVRGRQALREFYTRNAVSRLNDEGRITHFIRVDPPDMPERDLESYSKQLTESGTFTTTGWLSGSKTRPVFVPVMEGETNDQAYQRHLKLVKQWQSADMLMPKLGYGVMDGANTLTFGALRRVWPGLDTAMRSFENYVPISDLGDESRLIGSALSVAGWNKAPTGWVFKGVSRGTTAGLRWATEKAMATRLGQAAATEVASAATGARAYMASRLSGRLNTVSAWTFKNIDASLRRAGGRIAVSGDTIRIHVPRGTTDAVIGDLRTAWRAFRSEAAAGGFAPRLQIVRNATPLLGQPGIGPIAAAAADLGGQAAGGAATAAGFAVPGLFGTPQERQASKEALPGLIAAGAAIPSAFWLASGITPVLMGSAGDAARKQTYAAAPGAAHEGAANARLLGAGEAGASNLPTWRGPKVGPPPAVGPRYPAVSSSRLPAMVAPNLPETGGGAAFPLLDHLESHRRGLQETLRVLSDGREVERFAGTWRGLANEQEAFLSTLLQSKTPPSAGATAIRERGMALRARLQALQELAGKDRAATNTLLAGQLDDILFIPTIGPDAAAAIRTSQLARWAQGVAEQTTRRGIPVDAMFAGQPPVAPGDLQSLVARVQKAAEAVAVRDPSAPVAPPEDLLPTKPPTLRQALPVMLTMPASIPRTPTVAHELPAPADIAKNGALTTLHMEFADAAAHGQPFTAGTLVPTHTLALGPEEPAQIPMSFDDGRLVAWVPNPAGAGAMPVDVTGVDVIEALRLAPEADWRMEPAALAPVAFALDKQSSRLLVDAAGSQGREWISQLMRTQMQNEWRSGLGELPTSSAVSLAKAIAAEQPQTPAAWRAARDAADSLLVEHRSKMPSLDDAAKLVGAEAAPREHGHMVAEWFALGSLLETVRAGNDAPQAAPAYSAAGTAGVHHGPWRRLNLADRPQHATTITRELAVGRGLGPIAVKEVDEAFGTLSHRTVVDEVRDLLPDLTATEAAVVPAIATAFYPSGQHVALTAAAVTAFRQTQQLPLDYAGPFYPAVRRVLMNLNALPDLPDKLPPGWERDTFGEKLAAVYRVLTKDVGLVPSTWLARFVSRHTGATPMRWAEWKPADGSVLTESDIAALRLPGGSKILNGRIFYPTLDVGRVLTDDNLRQLAQLFPSTIGVQRAIDAVEGTLYELRGLQPPASNASELDVSPIDLSEEVHQLQVMQDFAQNLPAPADVAAPVEQANLEQLLVAAGAIAPSDMDVPIPTPVEFRRGTSKRQESIGLDLMAQLRAYNEGILTEPWLGQGGVQTVAVANKPYLSYDGSVTLKGIQIDGAESLAAAAQVLRSTKFETFHVFYVNAANGEILEHEAVTNRIANGVAPFDLGLKLTTDSDMRQTRITREQYNMQQRAARIENRTGASVLIWFLHNHPSSRPEPSAADVAFTKAHAARLGAQFAGHVVINHSKYGVIRADGSVEIAPLSVAGADALREPALPHPGLGLSISSPQELAALGQRLHRPDSVTALYLNQNAITAIQHLPAALLDNAAAIRAHLRGRKRDFGATDVSLILDSVKGPAALVLGDLTQDSTIRDAYVVDVASVRYANYRFREPATPRTLRIRDNPQDRADALEWAASGRGWSRGEGPRLFQVLTNDEKFAAVLRNIQSGPIIARQHLDRLNPQQWQARQKWPTYFQDWRPTEMQAATLQAAWKRRSKEFDINQRNLARLTKFMEAQAARPTADAKMPGLTHDTIARITPELLDEMLRTNPRAFDELKRQFFDMDPGTAEAAANYDRAVEAIRSATEGRLDQLAKMNAPKPGDSPSGMRIIADEARITGTAAAMTLKTWFGRPSLVLGHRKQAPTPAEYRRLLATGDVQRSVFQAPYIGVLQKSTAIRKAFAEFEPLAKAAKANPRLDAAIFHLLDTLSMDEHANVPLDIAIPESQRYFEARVGIRNVRIDLHEWMPKLRRAYDRMIDDVQAALVDEANYERAATRARLKTLDAEIQRRELTLAQQYARAKGKPVPQAWSELSPRHLKALARVLRTEDAGDSSADPLTLVFRTYRSLVDSRRGQAKRYDEKTAAYQKAKAGGYRREKYATYLYDLTYDDVRQGMKDPYGPYALYSRPDIRTSYLLERNRGERHPVPSWVDSWFLYVPAMAHRTHLGPALRAIEPKIAQLPDSMRMYALEWVRALKGAETPQDRMLNGIVRSIIGKDLADRYGGKPFSEFMAGITRLGFYGLLNPLKTAAMSMTEIGFLARELGKDGLAALFSPTKAPLWAAKGLARSGAAAGGELGNAARRLLDPTVPRWYSEPSLLGVSETLHGLIGHGRYSTLASRRPETAVGRLLNSLGSAVFSPIGATEFILRAFTYETLKERAIAAGVSTEDAVPLAAVQTNDLIGAYGTGDTSPHLRGAGWRSLVFLRRFMINKTELAATDFANTLLSRGHGSDFRARGGAPPPPEPPDAPGTYQGWADDEEEAAWRTLAEPVGRVGMEAEVSWQARKAQTWAAFMWVPSILLVTLICGAIWGGKGAVSNAWPFVSGLSEMPAMAEADELWKVVSYPFKMGVDHLLPGESISPYEEREIRRAYENLLKRLPWGIGPLVRLHDWWHPAKPQKRPSHSMNLPGSMTMGGLGSRRKPKPDDRSSLERMIDGMQHEEPDDNDK